MTSAEAQRKAEHDRSVRSISLGVFWRLLRYPFMVLSAVVIPRYMGDDKYGEYAYFSSVYVMMDVLTDVGATQIFGRFLPELWKQSEDGVRRLLYSTMLYGVLITIAVIVFGEGGMLLSGRFSFDAAWWVILCLLLLTTKVEGTLFAFIYGSNQIARYSSKELLRSAATFVFVLVGYMRAGLTGAVFGLLLTEFVLLVFAFAWTRRLLLPVVPIMKPAAYLPYFRFGVKFYVPFLMFSFLQRSGNVFIKQITGESDRVAHFDMANQYLLLTGTFLGLLLITLLPALTNMYVDEDHGRIRKWHRNVMIYSGVVIVLTVNALLCFGEPVIRLVLGEDFAPVFPIAAVMSLALPAMQLAYAAQNYALLEKRTRTYLAAVVVGFATMAVACLILVPRFDEMGAGWASVIGYLALAAVCCIGYWRDFQPMLVGMTRAALPGVACVPFWMLADDRIGLGVGYCILSSLIYVALILVLRVVHVGELKHLIATLRAK